LPSHQLTYGFINLTSTIKVSKPIQGHHSLVIIHNLISLLPYILRSHPANLKASFNTYTTYTPFSNLFSESHTHTCYNSGMAPSGKLGVARQFL